MAEGVATQQAAPMLVEDFRGDFVRVASLIQESWKDNGSQGLFYTEDFLQSCLHYPGSNYALAPTLYQGEQPCAFVVGLPRTIRYQGRELRVILCTLLSVCSDYKHSGYGIVLWNELVKRAREAGFDGMVNYCVEGEAMNGMILGCCRLLKLPTQRILSIPYLMRVLHPGSTNASSPAEHAEDLSPQEFLRVASLRQSDASLTRVWSNQEARWQLERHGAVVAHHRAGDRFGLLTGYLMPAANPQRTKCLLVEDVLWGTLESEERLLLVRQLLDRAARAGAQMAFLPCLGYADVTPFKAARFRASQRILHCYLTVFSGQPAPEPLPSMYLDVI